MGSFPVQTVVKRFWFSVHPVNNQHIPVHLPNFKNCFPPTVFEVPIPNNAAVFSAVVVVYDMDWGSRVFTCTPECHVGLMDGVRMPKVRWFRHLTPQRVLLDFSILFPLLLLLLCFGCCRLRCRVSLRSFPAGLSCFHSFLLSPYGCCWCLRNALFFIKTFNRGLISHLWRWWRKKQK